MLTINIYKSGKKIDTKSFKKNFYILKDEQGLYWETGEEQYEKAEIARDNKELGKTLRKGGVFEIWIRARLSLSPADIQLIKPDWQLIIDGIVMERGVYADVYVSGKTIELVHGEYRFVCSFPPFEGGSELIPEKLFTFIPTQNYSADK